MISSEQSGDRGLIWAGWSVLIISAGIVVAVPLIMLTRTSWLEGADGSAEVLTEPGFGTAVAHSFELSAAVTALAVPIGVAIALSSAGSAAARASVLASGGACCPCSFQTSCWATAGCGPMRAAA